MIKFTLKCDDDHRFEAWFRSNADFLEQQESSIIACPNCGSTTISKGLMTPSVPIKSNQKNEIAIPAIPNLEGPAPTPNVAAGSAPIKDAKVEPGADTGSRNIIPSQTASPPSQLSDNAQNMPNPLAAMPPELREKVVVAVRQWRDAVVASADNVGKSFAEEARKIHYKEAKERPILGEASLDEVQDLLDEGIECAPLPILPEDHN